MAKWYGRIGYVDTIEVEPGVYEEQITWRPYYGDVLRNSRLLQNSGNINDDVNISIQISIVADPYATDHIHTMRCVEYMGSKWKVTNVDVQYPRLTLSIGGLYTNGEQSGSTE